MKQKKHHKIHSLRELYLYILKKQDKGSMHRLEREMQRDPFLSDAVEGLSMTDQSRARKDIFDINHKINSPSRNKTAGWVLAVAASIALLIIAGLGFLVVEHSRQATNDHQLTHEPAQHQDDYQTPRNESLEQSLAEKKDEAINYEQQNEQQDITAPSGLDHPEPTQRIEKIIIATDNGLEQPEHFSESIDMAPTIQHQQIVASSPDVTPEIVLPHSAEEEPTSDKRVIKGTVVDQTDQQPLPGVTVFIAGTTQSTTTSIDGEFALEIPDSLNVTLVASFIGMQTVEFMASDSDTAVLAMQPDLAMLEEVVVTGYGVRKRLSDRISAARSQKQSEISLSDRSPEPVNGYVWFYDYLEKNAVLPDTSSVSELLVLMRFEVDPSGKPGRFEIIESPNDSYALKAIEIITKGPDWNHAIRNGDYYNEKVNLDIMFRKP